MTGFFFGILFCIGVASACDYIDARALALGGVFAIDHMDARRAWMTQYREDVWRMFEEMER